MDTQQPPWRVLRAFPQEGGGTLVHLQNVSGGILAGDDLELGIELAAGAIAQVTTTGATRLYRHRPGVRDSRQRTTIAIAEGATLEYLPDMLIPFAGSRHEQSTRISVGPRAAVFFWETLAPGRQAMGETFAYDRLAIRTEVRTAERPVLIESALLDPAARRLESLARLGPYTHAANFYAIAAGHAPANWLALEAELNRFCSAHSTPGDIILGSSALAADGVAVRALTVSARELPRILTAVWRIAKRWLTGHDAVPPRKVY